MSADLKQARVYYAARTAADPAKIKKALDKALGFIKQEVARENMFRLMPEIIFLPDTGLDRLDRLEQLLLEAGMSSKPGEGQDN